MNVSPPLAVASGAQWHLRPLEEAPNPDVWHDSGEMVAYPAGTYTLVFETISGWHTLGDQSVTVIEAGNQTAAGSYTQRHSAVNTATWVCY